MDYLISTTLTRYTLTFKVEGNMSSPVKSCGLTKFRVPSGCQSMSLVHSGLVAPPFP